jgi:glycyl-tRNA synthetase beta chain
VGIAVSLADKLDTIVAVFSQKNAKLPSGSKDPLGLRRMASGIIQTVLENKLRLDLLALMRLAYQSLVNSTPATAQFQDEATTLDLVNTFVLQRLRGMLLEQDNRYDMIDAVLEADKAPLSDIQDVLVRIEHLKQLSRDADALKAIYEPANRIYKILGAQYNPNAVMAEVHASAFRDPSEHLLGAQVQRLEVQADSDYGTLIAHLAELNPAVELFFEKVMVNDPDDTVRKNRYNLLSVLNRFYLQLACFPKLVV